MNPVFHLFHINYACPETWKVGFLVVDTFKHQGQHFHTQPK